MYRPEKGEGWIDVMERAKKFLNELADRYIFNKEKVEEEKKVVKKEPAKEAKKETKKEAAKESKKEAKKDNKKDAMKLQGKGLHEEHKQAVKKEYRGEEKKEVKKKPKSAEKKVDAKKSLPKVLAVTHGGFIMEFVNVYREIKGMGVSEKNIAKNTAIYAFQVACANCKGICRNTSTSCKDKKLAVTMLKENDNKHLATK
eukprot:TRINITY_DN4882_c0_g1_i7.p2 TRINITY_DN4882_c0_g1~~TRINITY_DN4882_c0_g1_i7.p2  ORF type:complete len:200 (+),score=97.18 TRINITY_DN4882_c0_g1_i7:200-799(+)